MNFQQASSLVVPWLAAAALAMATGPALAQTSITTDTTISTSQTYSGDGLNVGSGTSPGPTLTINSGANVTVSGTVSSMFAVGTQTGAYAAVVQNGGTVSVGASVANSGQLYLGVNRSDFGTTYSPGSASYTLNGGSITVGSVVSSSNSNLLLLGRSAGNNTFTQTGGTVTVFRTGTNPTVFIVGSNGQGPNTYTITSGTFEGIGASTTGRGMSVGGATGGDGTLTINGSSAVFAVQQINAVFSANGGSATINLNAGTLALNGDVTRGNPGGAIAPGAVAFTLGGGTLRPYDKNLTVGLVTGNAQAFDITLAANTTSTITGVGWKSGTHTVLMETPLIGSGNIEISGGTVVFNRSGNTYSGSTTISGGTLSLDTNGAFSNSPVITIASGAALSLTSKTASGFTFGSGQTLAGSGSVLLPTSGSGVSLAGFLAPGGSLETGTLAFANAGTFDIQSAITGTNTGRLQFGLGDPLISGASDLVTVASGTLAIGSGLLNFDDFDFTALAGFGQGTYTLFSADSILGTLGSGTSGTINGLNSTLQQSGGDIQLIVVPEPAGLALAGLGIAAAAWAGRRGPRPTEDD